MGFISPPPFTSTSPGIVPASGGGTVNFLRADGSWNNPAASGVVLPWIDDGVTLSKPLAASMLTTTNGTLNLTDRGNWLELKLLGAGATGINSLTYKAPGASTWICTVLLSSSILFENYNGFALGVLDNTGKLVTFGFGSSTTALVFGYSKWNSISSFNSNTNVNIFKSNPYPMWLQLEADATNFIFRVSAGGAKFETIFIKSKTDFIGATISGVGVYFGPNEQSAVLAQNVNHYCNILSFTLV